MTRRVPDSEEIAILAPVGRDAALICTALERHGLHCSVVDDAAALCAAIEREVGAVIVAGEALTGAAQRDIVATLDAQPAWSDLPLLFLAPALAAVTQIAIHDLGSVTVLERPLHVETLVAAAQSALRARRRQYAARTAILQRDQFLAMLGHELRNPLGAILFASELLERSPSVDVDRHLAIIHRQATHLARLVDDLLEVSRVTSGKVKLNRRVRELGDSVQKAVQSLDQNISARSQRLSYAAKHRPIWVDADPVRLEQIFSNLLTNAIKYTPEGGTIDVSVDTVGADGVVRIRDTGIGIEPAMLTRIFDLFEQANATVDRARGGMGLGLTLVRRLVELHGGSVEAHSDGLGRGSEFVVRFPVLARERTDVAFAKPAPRGNTERLRVVLVDDSADICEAFSGLLKKEGHDVQVATDGPAGLELISSSKPDCAFVDIGLPGLDGYQVARRVRSTLGRATHLVALTGYGQPEDRERALEAGFDRHMKKPIDIAAVTELLREVAQGLPRSA
jgi:signal transduction histidine kinase/ActR/RegA family two-component response regulator